MDCNRKLCSAQPSKARKPFCSGENVDDALAQEAIRLAMRAEYNLYTFAYVMASDPGAVRFVLLELNHHLLWSKWRLEDITLISGSRQTSVTWMSGNSQAGGGPNGGDSANAAEKCTTSSGAAILQCTAGPLSRSLCIGLAW
ncbi:hypothetical protein EMCRGX_G005378 [Ephydatia muelleri]